MREPTTFTFTIEIYTDSLQIIGSYDLPSYRRVSDALNNRIQRFVSLHDATIAPLWKPQFAQRVDQMVVDWSEALLVATIAEPKPTTGTGSLTPPRDQQPLMIFTPAFALRADFYKRTDRDLITMVNEMTDEFASMTNATIYPLVGGVPVQRKFVCLKIAAIRALYASSGHLEQAPIPPGPPASEDF